MQILSVILFGGRRKTDRVGLMKIFFAMKFSLSTVLAVLMLAVAFTGCKKDDDDSKKKENVLQIGDTTIAITGGALVNYGNGGWYDGFNLDLNLFGEGVTMTEITPGDRDVNGNGFRFYCEMFSSDEDILVPGTYVFNDTTDVSPVNSFDYMDYAFKCQDGSWIYCTEGTIKVTKSGDTYELIITGMNANDEEISGYYKGPLQWFNDDVEITK